MVPVYSGRRAGAGRDTDGGQQDAGVTSASKHCLLARRLASGNEFIFDQFDFVVFGDGRKEHALWSRRIDAKHGLA
jgi:hypothetical protein